jgi:hypothetical protein
MCWVGQAQLRRFGLKRTSSDVKDIHHHCVRPDHASVQGVVQPVTVVCSIALALAPLFNWLLIFKLRLGIDGAVAAMVCSNATMLLLLVAYVVWLERRRIGTPEQTWHGW